MKIRNSFVSNSSSASFICYWRYLHAKNSDIKQILQNLFDDWGNKHTGKVIDELVSSTGTTNSLGTFRTAMYTIMYNDISDVPLSMAYLITGLKINSNLGFELIDITRENDQ